MFDLERLSKIKGAKSNQEIMNFFDVLDSRISDQDLEHFINSHNNKILNLGDLRADEVIQNTTSQIIREFPESQNNHLKIPKVIE